MLGEWFDGKIYFANSAETSIAYSMINKKYGMKSTLIRIFNKFRGTKPLVIAIVPN